MMPSSWSIHRLVQFRRKAIRIVDEESKVEIGLSPVVMPWVAKKWGILTGGLVFVNDVWSWLPAGDLVVAANLPGFQACWHQRLAQGQCLVPQ
jgi:hypothetical protein